MKETLVDMMSNFIDLTDEEKQGILEAFPIKTFAKETDLLKEGQIAKDAFVVIKGCIRKYSIQNGEEITSEFYTEFQSAVNFDSMANKKPSKYYLSCTEETTVAIMNSEKENALYKKFPRIGEVCRVEMEKILGENQEAFSTFKNASPKERYLNLLKNRPDLILRVAQHQLASYLGVKPETLSRIRKRILVSN
jgi:signal-transduction protein with cAMP-binding, CBS, and nucleotidyltransferase domain